MSSVLSPIPILNTTYRTRNANHKDATQRQVVDYHDTSVTALRYPGASGDNPINTRSDTYNDSPKVHMEPSDTLFSPLRAGAASFRQRSPPVTVSGPAASPSGLRSDAPVFYPHTTPEHYLSPVLLQNIPTPKHRDALAIAAQERYRLLSSKLAGLNPYDQTSIPNIRSTRDALTLAAAASVGFVTPRHLLRLEKGPKRRRKIVLASAPQTSPAMIMTLSPAGIKSVHVLSTAIEFIQRVRFVFPFDVSALARHQNGSTSLAARQRYTIHYVVVDNLVEIYLVAYFSLASPVSSAPHCIVNPIGYVML